MGIEDNEKPARPFCKSAGGKTRLLPELLKRMPAGAFRYHEPFVGGGALFYALVAAGKVKRAYLGDANPDLAAAWQAVQRHPEDLIKRLRRMPNTQAFYDKVKRRDTAEMEVTEQGARFIFLNKTAHAGLWRVNKAGEMNTPFGNYERPAICDAGNIRRCSAALRGAVITWGDFAQVERRAQPGDVVYLDPPYIPVVEKKSFTRYTAEGFVMADHVRLRDMAKRLAANGVNVLASNSSAELATDLWNEEHGFDVHRVWSPRSVNSKSEDRGEIPEILAVAGPVRRA